MSKNILDDILDNDKLNFAVEENLTLDPLLNELSLISSEEIKSFVRSLLLKSKYFWSSPEVENDPDRPFDEIGPLKSVLHTKRTIRVAAILSAVYLLAQEEHDIVIAACLLHEVVKYKDLEIDEKVYQIYDPLHPYTVGDVVSLAQSIDRENLQENISTTLFVGQENLFSIMRLIRCQMGVWSPVPETYPVTYLDYIVNISVTIANNLHNIIGDSDLIDESWRSQY